MSSRVKGVRLLDRREERVDGSSKPEMGKTYYVYILRNNRGLFYIGITSDLVKRVWEHQNKTVDSFTAKYNINKLIYYEIYSDPAG